ncbi:MAG: DUF881 domain-containing protein [Candidatus Peregrinibacteria bacterium]
MGKKFLIVLLITGFLVGLLITWQVLSSASVSSDYPTDEVSARDSLLKSYLDDQSYMQSRIVSLRKQIEDSQNDIASLSEVNNLSVLDGLKNNVGLTEVRGSGVEILIDDSPFALRSGSSVSDSELVQASDIRDIVNVLNAAGAQAVSVNNQRIIASSPISSVGTTLLVNNSYIAPPFNISAVGDTELMLQRLLNETLLSSLYDRSAKFKLVFEISVKEWITIPIYNGDLKVNYLNLVD